MLNMAPGEGPSPRRSLENYQRFDDYDIRRPAKRAWGEVLERFLRSNGGMTWNPVVAGKELDLYVLYHEVCKNGGVEAVVRGKRWKRVAIVLDLPASCTNAAYTLRKNYYRWLYAFECQDVHNIILSKEEVEKLAQGVEPGDPVPEDYVPGTDTSFAHDHVTTGPDPHPSVVFGKNQGERALNLSNAYEASYLSGAEGRTPQNSRSGEDGSSSYDSRTIIPIFVDETREEMLERSKRLNELRKTDPAFGGKANAAVAIQSKALTAPASSATVAAMTGGKASLQSGTHMGSSAAPSAGLARGSTGGSGATTSKPMQGARTVQNSNVPVLPQHPKRSIAMLPLHPPMSGMSGMAGQVPGMPGLVGSAGPWNAGMAAGRPIFAPAGMGMMPTAPIPASQRISTLSSSGATIAPVSAAAQNYGSTSASLSTATKKRDAEELAADNAKKPKTAQDSVGEGAGGGSGSVGTRDTSRHPVHAQQMEDEQLAAGLVQAAGARAGMFSGANQQIPQAGSSTVLGGGTSNRVAIVMLPQERSHLAKCSEYVLLHAGGLSIEILGWLCKVGIVDGNGNFRAGLAGENGEPVFVSPTGYYLRSAENVLRYIQAQRAYEAERGDVPFDFGSPSAGGGNVHGVQPPNKEEDGGGGQQGMQSKNQQQIEIDEKRKQEMEKKIQETELVKQQQQQQPQENNMDVEVEGETEGARAPLDEEMLKDVRFPLTLGNGELVVEALGEIIADHPLYHDNNYIFPVGYRARRTCANVPGQIKPQIYFCEVMHCGKQPLFRITPLNSLEGKNRTAANNPDMALLELNPSFRKTWNGAAFFGLEKVEVRGLIERLAGAHRCALYTRWSLGVAPPGTGPTQMPNFSVTLRRDIASTPLIECLKLVKEIMHHRCAWPFLEPVQNAHRGLEDYGSRIQRPMDLGTVLNKLKLEQYRNPDLCRLDVIQVWRNCLYYSGKKDDATSMAREVAEVFDSLFADRVLAPILQRSPHTPFTPQELIGQKVCVFDNNDFMFRDGYVKEYDASSQLHKVVVHHLKTEQYPYGQTNDKKEDTQAVFNSKKTAHQMPDLLPPSILMRINRREQERQARTNHRHHPNKKALTSQEWDVRWMKVPCIDVVLSHSHLLNGETWESEWPLQKADANGTVFPSLTSHSTSATTGQPAGAAASGVTASARLPPAGIGGDGGDGGRVKDRNSFEWED